MIVKKKSYITDFLLSSCLKKFNYIIYIEAYSSIDMVLYFFLQLLICRRWMQAKAI